MSSKKRNSATVVRGGSASSREWKILVLGGPRTGKTALIFRFVNGEFPSSSDLKIPPEMMETKMKVQGESSPVYVSLWNLPPNTTKPSQVSESFFKGAHGCVFVFSTTDQQSFTDLADWNTAVSDYCGEIPVVFTESKIDLIEETVMDHKQVESMAKSYRLRLYRSSAKADLNVKETFQYIVDKAVAKFPNPSEVLNSFNTSSRSMSLPSSASSAHRSLSAELSWDLNIEVPESEQDEDSVAPSKRRTGGVKPVFNRHNAKNCSLM